MQNNRLAKIPELLQGLRQVEIIRLSASEDIEFHGARWSWQNRKYAVLIPLNKIKPSQREMNTILKFLKNIGMH